MTECDHCLGGGYVITGHMNHPTECPVCGGDGEVEDD